MALRTATARWFELMLARGELTVALQCLAATGEVELQAHSESSTATLLPKLRAAVDEYKRLAQRYAAFWPPPSGDAAQRAREPEEIPLSALAHLRAWAAEADPIIDQLQKLAHAREELQLLEQLLAGAGDDLPDLHRFVHAGPILASRAYLLAPGPSALAVPTSVLVQNISCGESNYVVAVGSVDQIAALDDMLNSRKARRVALPSDLPAERVAAHEATRRLIEEHSGEIRGLDSRLQVLHRTHDVSAALADLNFIEWLVQNVLQLALTEHFAWITGWTNDLTGGRLEAALQRPHLHYLLRFPQPPRGMVRPVILRNPRWAQPFELFARLLGLPEASEADPSRLLAFVAPLMFGYMFADVGQGAVLVVAGAALRKKFPATALLIPGGCASIVFGVLFGSVFGDEEIIAAVWLRPLDRPLYLLAVSLVFGASVILLGLGLDALQYAWSARGGRWCATRAGLVLAYLGIIFAALDGRALWALPVGIAWYLIGAALFAPAQRWAAVGTAAGESLETLFQLVINTISFVRVGAFALAHAGLCSAIAAVAVATGSRPGAWLVLAVGNALIIAIEGLVVGIQTTRLVLFEFFVRFMQGKGRTFRPLSAPAVAVDLHPSPRTSA